MPRRHLHVHPAGRLVAVVSAVAVALSACVGDAGTGAGVAGPDGTEPARVSTVTPSGPGGVSGSASASPSARPSALDGSAATPAPRAPAGSGAGTVGPTAPTPTAPTAPDASEPAPDVAPSSAPSTASEPPSWFGTRALPDTATGYPAPQPVPAVYVDRRLATRDVLPPPPDDRFVAAVVAVPDDVLARSTWQPGCPVGPDRLRYVTVAFWGFDGRPHTGELLVADDLADDLVEVFALLHEQRFPIERMVITSTADLAGFHNRGDDNTTAVYECRPVTGGNGWSQHALGRAIDINPFHNPYLKDEPEGRVLLPVYAGAYLDRGRDVPGTIGEGDPVVRLFDRLGWEWGGRWRTLKDWQHFVLRG